MKNFQDHKENCCSNFEYKCEECEKCFKDENKLQNHRDKMHVKFECDECEKVFKYEAVLEKHKEAAHEDFQLFCHYYNNDKDCPFDDECMYIHEDSENCKFGRNCARGLCMYKHEESASYKECDDDSSDDDDDNDMLGNDGINFEDMKPALEKFKQAVEKFEELLGKHSLKCKKCEFEAKDLNGLTMHIKAKHKD